jgi:SAM-dependent methyltransferase
MSKQGESNIDFLVPLSELLKQCKIHPEELRAFVKDSLDDKAVAPGQDIEPVRYKTLENTDWKDKIVLDVGGYDGFAAEIAHKGGAARAICLDNEQYHHYGWEDKKKPGVEYVTGDLMDLKYRSSRPFEDHGTCAVAGEPEHISLCNQQHSYLQLPVFDVLINYNVLYHVKNPWAFLAKCREVIKPDGEMLLCTLFRYSDRPSFYLYEPRECNPTDESVFWGPSIMGLERLLKYTGWRFTQEGIAMDRVVYRCYPTEEPQFRQSRW